MATDFEITVIAKNEEIGYINIEEIATELRRIEKLLSSELATSETSIINANAGIKPTKVSSEFFTLIERALQLSELTNGAFDITDVVLKDLWKFDGSMTYLPTSKEINNHLSLVGHSKIILNSNEQTVFLPKKGMKISFDVIGKGYAMDKAKDFAVSKGVKGGAINAEGNATTWGTKATGEKWLLGVANPNPMQIKGVFYWLPIVESSVATLSADEEYIKFQNLKYNHIIDPRTGYPSMGTQTVSVFSKSAELSCALSKALHVMGKENGLAMIHQLMGTEAIMVTSDYVMHKSKGITLDPSP